MPPAIPLPTGGRWNDYLRWRHSQKERAEPKEAGLHCPLCGVVHPYHGLGQLEIDCEKQQGRWYILWVCPWTGDVIGELHGGITFTKRKL